MRFPSKLAQTFRPRDSIDIVTPAVIAELINTMYPTVAMALSSGGSRAPMATNAATKAMPMSIPRE